MQFLVFRRLGLLLSLLLIPSARTEAATPDLQAAIFAARDAVLPALVHVEPIIDVYWAPIGPEPASSTRARPRKVLPPRPGGIRRAYRLPYYEVK